MSHFDLIRQQARDFRLEVCGEEDNDKLLLAETLLRKTESFTGIRRLGLPQDDPLLCGALALLDEDLIYFDKSLPRNFALYCQAHEYAHLRLHETSAHCAGGEINFSVTETESFDAESRVLGYGQSERTEREANAFAAEFLLPSKLARKSFAEEKLNASLIAQKVGLPVNLVYSQLAQSLVAMENGKRKMENEERFINQNSKLKFQNSSGEDRRPKTEDQFQINAWQTESCPTLLEAAPGTGKTRTLIERICYLLREKQVAPESILALTFSNKAAEEMRERIARAVDKETATKIYITTFHAFGLNLLRKFHNAAGLTANAPVIDRIAAVGLLEERLFSLKLKHFQNLREPLENLPAILSAISRAKDELVSAEDFQSLAAIQFEKAVSADERERAGKCLETAHVYQIYEELLRERKLLDYGDLILRAVRLLRENEAIRESINEEFSHVLVDEYQDVNRAGAELLRLVSGAGRGVWAVGDARQAIYRWRGAAVTRNVRDFSKDFPEPQNLFLGVNYRSRPRVVAAVSTFAKELNETQEAEGFTGWAAHRREEAGEIRFAVTEDLSEEAAWMAEQMRELREKGVAWREQAVVARTHKILQKVAAELEKQGVPFLYLGNWLESETVRDLLSWLALIGGDKYALVRVANFTSYKISFAEVQRVISHSVESGFSIPEAIDSLAESSSFDETAKENFRQLAKDLSGAPEDVSIWNLLANYLFENGSYLVVGEKELTVSARLGLYQLLQLAQTFDAKNAAKTTARDSAIGEFLRYVRRLKIFGEEQALQQLPASMQETDAVRLLTIHACKGLEFEAVFIPFLGARFYPQSRKGNVCPLPDGVTDSDEKTEHAQEEKCLFFVAISRARQVLCLSRSIAYGKQPSNASPFLKSLATHLPISPESGATWYSQNFQPVPEEEEEEAFENLNAENFHKPEFYLRELEDYQDCPRRYFYHTHLEREKSSAAIYLEFHRSLHAALNFCLDETAARRPVSFGQIIEAFQNRWARSAYAGHAYAKLYETEAAEILQTAFEQISGASAETISNLKRRTWHLDLPNGRVLFSPSFFLETENEAGEKQVTAEYWRSGKLRKKESEEMLYQLFHEYLKGERDGGASVKVLSLKNGEEVFVPRKLKRGKEVPAEEKFASLINSIDGISRRNFRAKPNDNCPLCQFYFICPG